MKLLALAILLLLPQTEPKWIPIKEMSGPIPDHPGLTIETYATQIARREDGVRLQLRWDWPYGTPYELFKDHVPRGFDPSSIARFTFKADLNCQTLTVKAIGGTGEVRQFNGKKHKSKESPVSIPSGHIFAQYFCEQGTKPTEAPKLKPK